MIKKNKIMIGISLLLVLIMVNLAFASIQWYSKTRAVYRKTLSTPEESNRFDPFNIILVDSSWGNINKITICTNKDKSYSQLFVTYSYSYIPKNDIDILNISKNFLNSMKSAGGYDTFGCNTLLI